jgi:Fic family protein
LPKFEDKKSGQRLWNEADAYVKAFNDETEQVKKKIRMIEENNAKLKVEYPTLRYSSPRFPFYVNVIVALIVSVFPSLLTTFISYRLSEQKKEKDIGMNQQKFTQERKTEVFMAVNHDRNDQLLADKNAGLSVSQLAKKYGVSENRVRAILKSKTNKGV